MSRGMQYTGSVAAVSICVFMRENAVYFSMLNILSSDERASAYRWQRRMVLLPPGYVNHLLFCSILLDINVTVCH